MEWTREVSAGDWVGGHLSSDAGRPPFGFAACVRVFHPVFRERPVGTTWPAPGDERAWARFADARTPVDAELVTWATAARALGREFRAAGTWGDVSGADAVDDLRDADGWRYDDPDEGRLDPDALAALVGTLLGRTQTPDAGFAAIWDGWNGLVGSRSRVSGVPSRYSDDGVPQNAAVLRRSFKDAINAPFRKAAWQPGVLPDEVSRGPRLEVGGRSHVLFRAEPRRWSDPGWPEAAPWFEPGAPWVHSPSLIWPDDHAWLLVTDPASDTTYVAGDADTIAAVVSTGGVEAAALGD